MRAHVEMPVHDREGAVVAWAQIDLDDAELAGRRWHLSHGYPRTSSKGVGVMLHHLVAGKNVDHIDRNRLNARRSNLRPATTAQNLQNLGSRRTDLPRGVYRSRFPGRYRAMAFASRKQHYLGLYDSVEEASRVVSAWRAEHFPFSEDAR